MLQQYRAIGLHTDCMVAVPASVVRLLDSHVYVLWPWAMGCYPVTIIKMIEGGSGGM